MANRTAAPVTLTLTPPGQAPYSVGLESGDARPFEVSAPLPFQVLSGANGPTGSLWPQQAYEVVEAGEAGLAVRRLDFGGRGELASAPPEGERLALREKAVVSVKIFVDEDELRRPEVWEPALRARLTEASAALEAHAGVALQVVGVGVWNSDDALVDFNASLREFEQETRPHPADLAIGFTSQYRVERGRFHMGGTRGPLHSHLLVKERTRGITENERVELLLHELGHYLGAVHSQQPSSVMRPVLHRGPQRQAGARLQFDAANTLLMAMVGQDMRRRRVASIEDVTPSTRRRMREIYGWLERTLPEDSAATQVQRLVASASASQLIDDTRVLVEKVVLAAEAFQRQGGRAAGQAAEPDADSLCAIYVRAGANGCRDIERQTAAQALLLALGVVVDDTGVLQRTPVSNVIVQRVENEALRQRRLAAVGAPTLHARSDLAKHFFISAHATALAGGQAAYMAGLAKEMADARGGSGFSFADMAANRAGIAFANAVLTGRVPLEKLAAEFRGEDYMPTIADLPEGLAAARFAAEYGGASDPRYLAMIANIDARIRELPGYRTRP